jgi:hypothetical protein
MDGKLIRILLLLDNCPAHDGLDTTMISTFTNIIYFPPNVTSRYQPTHIYGNDCLQYLTQKVAMPVLFLKQRGQEQEKELISSLSEARLVS